MTLSMGGKWATAEDFIGVARSIAGRDAFSPFSLEDVYSIARHFGLKGIIFLEKLDDRRHVNVLLNLKRNAVILYDPLSGVKSKPCDEIQLGMYCKPVGSFLDDFQKYEQQSELEVCTDVWVKYKKRGNLLLDLFMQHEEFRSIYRNVAPSTLDFPALQRKMSSSDCAPIALFIMFWCSFLAMNGHDGTWEQVIKHKETGESSENDSTGAKSVP
ncbi:hypothetical protein ACFLU6_11375 [Acidobacteriota bacterium]